MASDDQRRSATAGKQTAILPGQVTGAEDGERLWWQRGVVYQVYPRSFKDSNGDGIGDLKGVTEKLDYLSESLGVEAIWLSPFYPSPMADFGYDVANYVDVDPMFGTLEEFDELVREAHARDLKLIIDFVPNHTSDQHPWFRESCSSRQNPKRDWYVWADPKADGSPPNNWLAVFGGPAWELDTTTGQYYLHSFLKEQPDLNWRNPTVKEAMFDVLRFWLERGVDGFRIDVAQAVMKDPELRDNPPNPDYRPDAHGAVSLGPYEAQLHLYDKAHVDVHTVYRDLRRLLDSYSGERPRVAIGEIHIFDWPEWVTYYGTDADELHLPFNFGLLAVPWQAEAVRAVVDGVEAAMTPRTWPNYVLGNHDVHRIASRVGPEQARAAMMLLLTLRGTPTMYYGDEIGMHDVPIPPEREQDPFGKRVPGFGLGRDPERTPMQWNPGPNAGFCPACVEPWLPLAPDYREANVEVELQDARSMLALTRALLALRRSSPALHWGSYRPVGPAPPDCFVYLREHDRQTFLVALNLSAEERTVACQDFDAGKVVLSTRLDREESVNLAQLVLRPNEGCIVSIGKGNTLQ